MKKNFAIILGRKGSQGFKNKNTMKILNKPAYEYAIDAAKGCKKINKIYFSTDIEEIIDKSSSYGINIIKRPKKLCGEIPIFDVYKHAYQKLVKKNKVKIIVGLQPDHPDRTITVDKVISIFKNRKLDALFSCDEKKIKNGSYYLIKKNILEGKKVKKKFTVLDNCTNIHYLADLKKIEKKFKKIKWKKN